MTSAVRPIQLAERICNAKHGVVSQPEYCPRLVRKWAEMPIKAYFGRSIKWRMLFRQLGLDLKANPTYQEVAAMIHEADPEFMGELLLLASPVWDFTKGGKEA